MLWIVVIAILLAIVAYSVVNKARAGKPLCITLSQRLDGRHDLIVGTLESLATLLQSEVDKRAARYGVRIAARPVDASTYRLKIAAQSVALGAMLHAAERQFAAAGSPSGSPSMLQAAYGRLLEGLLSARRVLLQMNAPATFSKTEPAYRDCLDSLYLQIAGWPAQVREAAGRVEGDSFDLELSATYDTTPLTRAIAAESSAAARVLPRRPI